MEKGVINIVNNLDGSMLKFSICILAGSEKQLHGLVNPGIKMFEMPKRRSGFDYTLFIRLARLMRREKIDIVHTHNWSTYFHGVAGAKLAFVPVIIHGEHGFNFNELREGLKKRMAKKALSFFTDRIITMSNDLRKRVCLQLGAHEKKVLTIYNGVETDKIGKFSDPIMKESLKKELGLEGKYIVGAIGRLDKVKNFGLLLMAMKEVVREYPDVSCIIIGEGPEEKSLRKLTSELGVISNIKFAGYQMDVQRFLNVMDIFVLPSVNEGLSNALLEAMASSVPVIASDVGGNKELIRDGENGYLFPPGDHEKLTALIIDLMKNKSVCDDFTRNARDFVKTGHSLQRMIGNYSDLYRSFLPSSIDPAA